MVAPTVPPPMSPIMDLAPDRYGGGEMGEWAPFTAWWWWRGAAYAKWGGGEAADGGGRWCCVMACRGGEE